MKRSCWLPLISVLLIAIGAMNPKRTAAADTLTWNTNVNRVTADITSVPLIRVLEGVSQLTGWHVYLESNSTRNVSVKFKDLPSGEALRNLLGNLSFALVPQTNSRSRLYVFRSSQENATMLLQPGSLNGSRTNSALIPNELVVTLKRGKSIDGFACLEKAKIVGRIEGLNTYRVRFEDETATRTARECLSNNPDVESIESNYSVDRPEAAQRLDANVAQDINLKQKDPNSDCTPTIALIDTGIGGLSPALRKFLLSSITVAEGGAASSDQSLSHGTAMLETIFQALQKTTDGSTSARMYSFDVFGGNETASTYDIAKALYMALSTNVNVVNMSFGTSGESPLMRKLIKQGIDDGVVFFGAAGNEPVTTPTFPAAYPEVIAVTAGDRNGQVASYANRGSFVDLMTPGTSIVPFNGQSWIVNGTSAATAYASGIAAGLADVNRECPPGVISTMRSKLGVTFSNQ